MIQWYTNFVMSCKQKKDIDKNVNVHWLAFIIIHIIKVLYFTKTNLYKSNYQLISFVIARGYYEKHITRLDIIVCK